MAASGAQIDGSGPAQTRTLFRAWIGLAAAAVTVAALLVIPPAVYSLVGSESVFATPAIVRFLVGHVFFALAISCMSFQAVLWMLAILWVRGSRYPLAPGWAAFAAVATGSILIFTSALGHRGEPALTDFVPVVMEPVFLLGFGLTGLGFGLTIACFLFALATAEIERMPLVCFGMLCSALIVVASILSALATLARLFGDWFSFEVLWDKPYSLAQTLFWGPGHLVEFSVAAAMATSWILLMPAQGLNEKEEGLARVGFLTLVVFSAIVLFILYAVDPAALPELSSLNAGIRGFLTLPILLLAGLILRATIRGARRADNPALFLSGTLFAVALLMAVVGVATQRKEWMFRWVPAHFEAMVLGAVLVAFMGATTDMMPLWGRTLVSVPLARLQSYLYSVGILILSAGNFWASFVGGERRAYFLQVSAARPLILVWIGGIMAELGVLAFAANIFGALFMPSPLLVSEGTRASSVVGSS